MTVFAPCYSYLSPYFRLDQSKLHPGKMQKRWTSWNLTQDITREKPMKTEVMTNLDMDRVFSVHISNKRLFSGAFSLLWHLRLVPLRKREFLQGFTSGLFQSNMRKRLCVWTVWLKYTVTNVVSHRSIMYNNEAFIWFHWVESFECYVGKKYY